MTGHAVARSGIATRTSSARWAVAMMLAFVALWALIETTAAVVLHHVLTWQVEWTRFTVHLLIVLAIWGRRGAMAPWRTRKPRQQLVRSAMMLIMPASWAIAASRGDAASMMLAIFWSAPLLVLALAAVIERERMRVLAWLAAGLGWVGAWLFYAPEELPSAATIALSLAMAASFALYVVMTRGLRSEPMRVNLFYTAIVPWIALLPVMPRVWVTPAPGELAGLLFIGAAGWLGFVAIDRAVNAAPVSQTAPMLCLQIAGVAILAALTGHGPSFLRLAASTTFVGAAAALAWLALPRTASPDIS